MLFQVLLCSSQASTPWTLGFCCPAGDAAQDLHICGRLRSKSSSPRSFVAWEAVATHWERSRNIFGKKIFDLV
ncbi:MAG: hypothetical protein E5W21_19150 [Mesorhizobium sp.]|nr:MAG: hypothetical protein E5W21_19150 [Mesorhizobium sp.]